MRWRSILKNRGVLGFWVLGSCWTAGLGGFTKPISQTQPQNPNPQNPKPLVEFVLRFWKWEQDWIISSVKRPTRKIHRSRLHWQPQTASAGCTSSWHLRQSVSWDDHLSLPSWLAKWRDECANWQEKVSWSGPCSRSGWWQVCLRR
jgi:hypothetical protein